MSDDAAKTARLRELVGKILPDEKADSFVQYARLDAFTGEDGEVDETRVMGHLTAIHAASQQARQWGQYSGAETGAQPGSAARRALEKRHNVKNDAQPQSSGIRPGAAGRAAAARRHNTGGRK